MAVHVADFEDAVYTAVLDALPIVATVLEGSGRILAVNNVWAAFHDANGGHDGNYFVGHNYLATCRTAVALGDAIAAECTEKLEALLGGQSSELNLTYPCDSPEVQRWFRLVGRRLEDTDPPLFLLLHIDESAEHIAELKRRQIEARFRKIIEDNTDAILIVSEDGIVHYANPVADQLFSQEEGGLTGHRLGIPVVLDSPVETTVVPREGAPRICEIRSTRTSWENVTGYFVQVRDVTEAREYAGSQAKLAAAVQQAVEGIYITDEQGVLEYVNPAFCKISGYTSSELLGATPRFWSSGNHSATYYQRLWSTIKARRVWTGEIENRKKDGTLYQSRLSITPLVNDDETVTHFVAICQDITEEKRLEERVRQSQKMEAIGTLAGGIAHDFNNILSAIFGYTELAIESLPDDAEIRPDLAQVLQAAGRARDLVQQILTFSREADHEKRPVRIDILTKEVLKLMQAMLPATIETQDQVWSPGAEILGDPTQLHQVLMNLCTNAFHAMREQGGILSVTLQEEAVDEAFAQTHPELEPGAYYVLAVSDTGIGMEPWVCNRIFEPFFSTKPKDQGTGLGLATSLGIVRDHGGALLVESQPGAGSTFRAYLPALPHRDEDDQPQPQQAVVSGNGEHILIVDDESGVADILARGLQRIGYKTEMHTEVLKALAAFEAKPDAYDLIISDQTMPKMTGLEFATAVHLVRPDLPVIIATGYSDLITPETLAEAGVDRVVPKPVTLNEMSSVLYQTLHGTREQGPTGLPEGTS